MLEAMVPPSPSSASASQGGGGGAKAKEATPIPLKALNLIAMHPKIRLMEMVKVCACIRRCKFSLPDNIQHNKKKISMPDNVQQNI